MLAQLGATQFEIAPLNAHELTHEGTADFAEKPVMGRRRVLAFAPFG